MVSEKKLSILEKYIIFSETDTKTVKVLGYGIAGLSLAIALYRIKPFAKYRNPSSIPARFLHKKVQLQGTVVRVDPSCGTLLMVDHQALIPIPRLGSPKYLPIKIAGLDVTANGISWLQIIVSGKKITFIPLAKEKQYVSCIVSMQHKEEHLNIGEELVKLGFAITKDSSTKSVIHDKDILNYPKCLLNAQKWAQRKRNGYWHFAKHPTLLWRMQQNFAERLRSILPKFIAQQLNI